MQLVLCNTQSELHPLEEGKHAVESGMDLRGYATAAGKARETLSKKVMAWRVLSVVHMDHEEKAKTLGIEAIYLYTPNSIETGPARLAQANADGFLEDARDSWRNLAEIHASPKWLWSALAVKMIEEEWTVQATREKVGKVKEAPKDLPGWVDAGVLADRQQIAAFPASTSTRWPITTDQQLGAVEAGMEPVQAIIGWAGRVAAGLLPG